MFYKNQYRIKNSNHTLRKYVTDRFTNQVQHLLNIRISALRSFQTLSMCLSVIDCLMSNQKN